MLREPSIKRIATGWVVLKRIAIGCVVLGPGHTVVILTSRLQDVLTLRDLYEVNLGLASPGSPISFYDVEKGIVSSAPVRPPSIIHNCDIEHTLVGEGSVLHVRTPCAGAMHSLLLGMRGTARSDSWRSCCDPVCCGGWRGVQWGSMLSRASRHFQCSAAKASCGHAEAGRLCGRRACRLQGSRTS